MPDRTLTVLSEFRADLRDLRGDLRRMEARLEREFSEIRDRLRSTEERVDGFIARVEILEEKCSAK